MDKAPIIISCVSLLVAIATFIWKIISDSKNRKAQKSNINTQGKIDKSNYVSKVLFDKIFSQFQALSSSMFHNYNNVATKLYPLLDTFLYKLSFDEKIKYMQDYYDQSVKDCNTLVELIHTNLFILTNEMVVALSEFEQLIKRLLTRYSNKIKFLLSGHSEEDVTELISKASSSIELYKKVVACFKSYIQSLQISD